MRGTATARAAAERRFYSGMVIFMIAMLLIGFAPSFYFRGLVHYPRPNPKMTTLLWLHGILFSSWMLLYLAQVRLVAAGRRDLHMKLGRWSMILAVALVPLMIATTIGQVAAADQPPAFTPLGWSAIPAFAIPAFILLVGGGWLKRRDGQAHKRLMLGAAILMMDPAFGRFPIFPPSQIGVSAAWLTSWLPFVALFIWDWRSMRRIHWATLFGATVMALELILRGMALTSPAWEHFAGSVVKLAGG